MPLFELERFIDECREAVGHDPRALKEVVAEAVADPHAVVRALGEPRRAELGTLHRSSDLTVLNLIWGPRMTLHAHDHRMLAVIGLYGGREDNQFYRRTGDGIETGGEKSLGTGDTVVLGDAVIHAVHNPLDELTGALHVYAGDFFGAARSEWDPETFVERPYDVENVRQIFDDSNRRLEERGRHDPVT